MKNIQNEIRYEQSRILKLIADLKTLEEPEVIIQKARELCYSAEVLRYLKYLSEMKVDLQEGSA